MHSTNTTASDKFYQLQNKWFKCHVCAYSEVGKTLGLKKLVQDSLETKKLS